MATPVIAQGDFTIVDYNDAYVLQGIIENTAGTPNQIYRTDTGAFTTGTSWDTTVNGGVNLVLMPRLFMSAKPSPIDICPVASGKTVKVLWQTNHSGSWANLNAAAGAITDTTAETALTDATNFALVGASGREGIKITKNLATNTPVLSKTFQIRALCVYTDTVTTMVSVTQLVFDLSVNVSTKGSVGVIITPSATLFKNGTLNQADFLTLDAVLMRGATADSAVTSYTWYQDGVVIPYTQVAVGSPASGSAVGYTGTVTATAATAKNLTIKAAGVNSKSTFRCDILDAADDNVVYSNSITILDLTDPYSVDISSASGGMFRASDATATTTLSARIIQNGQAIIAPAGTGYAWATLDTAGAMATWSAATIAAVVDVNSRPSYTSGALTATAGVLGASTIALTAATNVRVGHVVSGTGITAGTRVTKIVGNTVTLSGAITVAGGTSFTFVVPSNEILSIINTRVVSADDVTTKNTFTCKAMF